MMMMMKYYPSFVSCVVLMMVVASILSSSGDPSCGFVVAFAPSSLSSYRTSSKSRSLLLKYIVTSLDEHEPMYHHSPQQHLEATLDQSLSEHAIRKHYAEWCTKFHRRQDSFRFMVFQRNYLSQFKWNLAAGKQVFTLNEYADCTEEEYHQIMKRAAKNVVQNAAALKSKRLEGTAMEVTVIVDEYGNVAETRTGRYQQEDAIDAEVVEHYPFLGY